MANLPTFNPNEPGEENPASRRNRIITDVAEPGSTFKVVVISGAFNDGVVDLTDTFDCENGVFRVAGTRLRDHHGYGVLNVERIIAKSSNIGAAKIGMRMGQERVYHFIKAFGFGQRTGIPLPGEQFGFAWPLEKWNKVSISRIPMGHEIAATPLQITMAISAVANGGVLMKPMLVDRLVDNNGETITRFHPQPVRRVVSEAAAAKMVQAMVSVVSTNGTAIRARLSHYTVAGKTGTAQKIVNKEYVHDKHFVSFIGFFPAHDPELCIAVFMDEPKKGMYGGETTAPLFQRIADRAANYFAIPAERFPGTSIALADQTQQDPD